MVRLLLISTHTRLRWSQVFFTWSISIESVLKLWTSQKMKSRFFWAFFWQLHRQFFSWSSICPYYVQSLTTSSMSIDLINFMWFFSRLVQERSILRWTRSKSRATLINVFVVSLGEYAVSCSFFSSVSLKLSVPYVIIYCYSVVFFSFILCWIILKTLSSVCMLNFKRKCTKNNSSSTENAEKRRWWKEHDNSTYMNRWI